MEDTPVNPHGAPESPVAAVPSALPVRSNHELRQAAEQALLDSESRLRAIVNTAVDGIITIDDHGIMESANPAAQRIFGYSASEMIGNNVNMLMPSPYRDGHDGYLQNYMRTGQRKIIGIGREVTGLRKDGSTFPMDLAVSEMWLGGARYFTGIVRDITQRKQAEEDLRQAKESAEAANRAKDQFLAVLSHELRTPLTPVLAAVGFVEAQAKSSELREEITAIRRNIELEARLIDDLLDLTRISKGKLRVRSEIVDAHAMLRAALEISHVDAESKDLEVTIAFRAKQHHVRGDSARLQQIFWNLIKNAVKFTPQRGNIGIRTQNAESMLRVEISDNGIGIEPAYLPRIFNAFEQVEHSVSRRFGGLGLGLTISKALVEMHDGKLSAISDGPGKGATFVAEFPTVSEPPPQTAADTAAPISAKPPHKSLKILLVEDHEDTLRVMSSLLRLYGYEVRTAATVQRALELAHRERFDLLISDIGLPDGSGLDIIRSFKAGQDAKSIALSGYGMDDDIRKSLEAGFDQHLTKPVSPEALEMVIRQLAQ